MPVSPWTTTPRSARCGSPRWGGRTSSLWDIRKPASTWRACIRWCQPATPTRWTLWRTCAMSCYGWTATLLPRSTSCCPIDGFPCHAPSWAERATGGRLRRQYVLARTDTGHRHVAGRHDDAAGTDAVPQENVKRRHARLLLVEGCDSVVRTGDAVCGLYVCARTSTAVNSRGARRGGRDGGR